MARLAIPANVKKAREFVKLWNTRKVELCFIDLCEGVEACFYCGLPEYEEMVPEIVAYMAEYTKEMSM